MPKFFAPDDSRFQMLDRQTQVESPGYASRAATLGELLTEFGAKFGCRFEPHDPPQYFRYYAAERPNDYVLVDIHVVRDDREICLKQDLQFNLEPDDVVEAGVLIC